MSTPAAAGLGSRPYRVRWQVPAGWWAFLALLVGALVAGIVRADLRAAAYQALAPVARPIVLRWLLEAVGPRHGSPMAIAVSPSEEIVTLTKYQATLHRGDTEEILLTGQELRSLVGGKAPALSSAGFDESGRLWAGTWKGGVLVREDGRWRARVREEKSRLGQVTGWAPLGEAMLASSRRGSFRFLPGVGVPVAEIADRSLPAILRLDTGSVFAITGDEVLRRSPEGRWETVHRSEGPSLTALGDGGGGQLLVGTRDGFLRLGDEGSVIDGGLRGHWIRGFTWDRNGHLWVATWKAGAAWSDGDRWRWIGRWEGVPDAAVSFLHVDPTNRLWMGLYADQVHTLDLRAYLSLEGAR